MTQTHCGYLLLQYQHCLINIMMGYFKNQSKLELLYSYTSEAVAEETRSVISVHVQHARSWVLSVHMLICLPATPPSGAFHADIFPQPFRKASLLSIGYGMNRGRRKAEHD